MQIFMELVTNANLQAWVWGPLMGVLCGVLFAGITNPPTVNAPITVIQTKRTYITNVTTTGGSAGSTSGEGAGAIFFALAVGVMFLVWKYAIYIELVHYYLWMFLSTLLAFSMTTALVSLLKGQFTSASWAVFIVAPITILSGCGAVIALAKSSFDPELTQLASQHTFFDFYMHSLSAYGRSLMMSQVLGVAVTLLVMVFTGLALVHYLALMNQRSYGPLHGFWMFLTGATLFFSGRSWLFVLAFGLVLAYLLVDPGYIPVWMTKQ
ncbi:hypothetical protein [Pseudomonas fluorescens]|uniref:Uncharacterized protein n=1 Tax=Pseudomonas fluorescens TaxID=294 RepID=A0A5E7DVS9_PSEFL|nr:hypothetical protein [Pseudomonas fluorescens]VVO11352.1 hypothetical protein PS833_03456 [Pseudomonas fluorescens]